MDLVVKNGRVIDPQRKIDAVTDVVIREGKIRSVGSASASDIPILDATGFIVAPGFFDIHVHLREPGTEEAETIATGGNAAVAGGFTAVADYDTNAKMNPPLRSSEDVAAVVEGIADGTIDAIASDHAPHHINLKMLEFDRAPFGITGLETAVGLAFTRLKLPIARLIEMFSLKPQAILKVPSWGLFAGSDAD